MNYFYSEIKNSICDFALVVVIDFGERVNVECFHQEQLQRWQ